MRTVEYFSPQSLSEACTLLSELGPDVRILAGGTDLLLELRNSKEPSEKPLVDLSRISGLRGIEETGDSIVIKPLTTHDNILHSPLVAQWAPALAQAASTIGSPQIRNRGTVGGNVMNAAACADMVPPLMVLNARVKLHSKRNEREVDLAKFFVEPYRTLAEKEEILVEIRFQKPPEHTRSSFIKLGRRNALSIARLSVAAMLLMDSKGIIKEARIVPGAAFPTWQRVTEAERLLIGKKGTKDLFDQAGKIVSAVMISSTGRRWSTEYKEPVLAVLVRRALELCS
ncbi:MAG: xanthine dehydrogenase family protein subunit M [Bacteroidota bacterium]